MLIDANLLYASFLRSDQLLILHHFTYTTDSIAPRYRGAFVWLYAKAT
jgi:hypothetical protein